MALGQDAGRLNDRVASSWQCPPDVEMPMANDVGRRLFAAGSRAETARIAAILRKETVGGALLIALSIVALV